MKRDESFRQLEFQDQSFGKPGDVFGGSLLKSHPKVKRPLATKFPIHVVLRANSSKLRLPKTYFKVNQLIQKTAKKYGIKIYKMANVGNHLHLLIKLSKLDLWKGFIRELSSKIAALVDKVTRLKISRELYQGAKDLSHKRNDGRIFQKRSQRAKHQSEQKFWKHRPFTRIIRGWNKAFRTVKSYIDLNEWEAQGHISRKDIKTLKDLRALLDSG